MGGTCSPSESPPEANQSYDVKKKTRDVPAGNVWAVNASESKSTSTGSTGQSNGRPHHSETGQRVVRASIKCVLPVPGSPKTTSWRSTVRSVSSEATSLWLPKIPARRFMPCSGVMSGLLGWSRTFLGRAEDDAGSNSSRRNSRRVPRKLQSSQWQQLEHTKPVVLTLKIRFSRGIRALLTNYEPTRGNRRGDLE